MSARQSCSRLDGGEGGGGAHTRRGGGNGRGGIGLGGQHRLGFIRRVLWQRRVTDGHALRGREIAGGLRAFGVRDHVHELVALVEVVGRAGLVSLSHVWVK